MNNWIFVVLVLFLLALSALFSAAETSLTAVSRARIYRAAKTGKRRPKLVRSLLDSMEQLIGTILLGNNFVSILATSLTTSMLIGIFGESGIGIATLVMTVLLLIFAEVMPKVYAFQNAEKVALALSPFLMMIYRILSPVAHGIKWLVRRVWRIFGVTIDPSTTIKSVREDILSLIEMYSDPQMQREKSMLRGILDLSTVPVSDVMVHRKDLSMIDGDLALADVRTLLLESPYTRYPIWEGSYDNIIGILHLRSYVQILLDDKNLGRPVKSLVTKEPWFVPESTSLLVQLQEFRHRREHMAIVIDEYGTVEGIVTLEDILEEIVGEISDEYDVDREPIHPQKDGSYLIAGTMTIRDLNKHFDWHLPDQVATTLAGFLLHECQGIPPTGQTYRFYNMDIEVAERLQNQLLWIKVRPLPPVPHA